jgi:hypothetical protein
MGKDGRDPSSHGASRTDGYAGEDLYDVPATVVDPHAGRRAAAAIAGRGFGHNEVPTREAKDMVSRLAAHERAMARQRGAPAPAPVTPRRTTPRSFDLRLDALEEIEGPRQLPFAPIERAPGPQPGDHLHHFDSPRGTGAGVPVPARRSRGLLWILGATLVVAALAGAGLYLRESGLQSKVVTTAPGR